MFFDGAPIGVTCNSPLLSRSSKVAVLVVVVVVGATILDTDHPLLGHFLTGTFHELVQHSCHAFDRHVLPLWHHASIGQPIAAESCDC